MPEAMTLQMYCLFSELFFFLSSVKILKKYLFILEKYNKLLFIQEIFLVISGKMIGIFYSLT